MLKLMALGLMRWAFILSKTSIRGFAGLASSLLSLPSPSSLPAGSNTRHPKTLKPQTLNRGLRACCNEHGSEALQRTLHRHLARRIIVGPLRECLDEGVVGDHLVGEPVVRRVNAHGSSFFLSPKPQTLNPVLGSGRPRPVASSAPPHEEAFGYSGHDAGRGLEVERLGLRV